MSEKPTTTPFLDKIGLSEEEQKVYLSLLALGPLTAGEISKYSGVKPISKVRQVLAKLMERNYAYNIEGLVDKVIGLYPFKEIAAEAENDAKKIEQIVAEIKQFVTDQIAHFNQVLKETEEHVRAEKSKATTAITTNSEQSRNTINNKITESKKNVTATADSSKKNVKTSADTFLKNQTDTSNAFEVGVNENFTQFSTELKANTETALKNLSAGIKSKNDEFLAEGTTALDTADVEIKAKADRLAVTIKEDAQSDLEGTRDHVLVGLDNFVNESEGNVKSLNESLVSATNEQASLIKDTTEEAKKNRIDLNNQFKTGLDTSFEKVKTDFADDLVQFQNKFNGQLSAVADKFKKQIDDLTQATAQDISLLCEEANASINDLIEKHNGEIAANVDLDNKTVEDGTNAMLAKVKKQNTDALKTINASVETHVSSLTLLKANYSGDINTKVNEAIASLHESTDASVEEAKTEYEATKTSITGQLETLTTGNSKTANSTAMKQSDEIKGKTDSLVTKSKESLSQARTAFATETKNNKEKIATAATKSIDTMSDTSNTTLGEVSENAKTAIRSNEETSVKSVSTIADVVETSVRKEIETVKGGFDSYYKQFERGALKITRLMLDFKNQHESLLNTVIVYPRPLIETALLYSKDAVFDRLEDMLTERIKSNVTMVIPDPKDIPTKTLAKVKAQAKITVISKIDEISNKNIIDQMKADDALGRIKIRKIGMQDMMGLTEYIAFDRDGGEEMLIAFKDETEKDWVGVLSTSDGFKNVVIGEILGRQALSISRELK
ncbi:MAG: hypothetical protein FK734_13840 [Asgard group archaeon]|nr:hypothetical protein [Asgard group archaeon]